MFLTPDTPRKFYAICFLALALSANACDDHIFSNSFEPIDLMFNAQVYMERIGGDVAVVWEGLAEMVYVSLWNLSDECEQASAVQMGGNNLGFGQFHFEGDEDDTFEFRLIPNGNSVRFTYGAVKVPLLTVDE